MLKGWAKVSKREYLQAVRKKGIKGLRLRVASVKFFQGRDYALISAIDSERRLIIKIWVDDLTAMNIVRVTERKGLGWVWVVDKNEFAEEGRAELEDRRGGFFVLRKQEKKAKEEEEEKKERKEDDNGLDWLLERF